MLETRMARTEDLKKYWAHDLRHSSESGSDGDIIFSPFEEPWNGSEEETFNEKSVRWLRPITEIGWERCWVLADNDGIYGDVKLVHHPDLKSMLHRARLMIGIERVYRSQGWGAKLVTDAITWAREQPSLDWVDLSVFSHNKSAMNLYSRFGFREIGRAADLFRVGSQKIEDIQMTLKLRD
jgi:RimJ/RimL family protein N-acetyltransferase